MPRRRQFKIPDLPRNRPTVPEVKPLVKKLYESPGGGAGCCLHTVLDDGNFDTCVLESCLEYAQISNHPLCQEIASKMIQMTKTQRRKLH